MLFDGAFRPPAGTGYGKRASSAIEVGLMSEAIFTGGSLGGWQADGEVYTPLGFTWGIAAIPMLILFTWGLCLFTWGLMLFC